MNKVELHKDRRTNQKTIFDLVKMNLELNIENILLLVFGGMFIIQLFYFLFFFVRMSVKPKLSNQKELPPVSIIIAARNEEKNLTEKLPKIFAQDYPEFQVVIVNDRSWDESLDVLAAFYQKHENLKVVENPDVGKDGFAKKFAITLGIKAAKYDKMIFIDADCEPASKNWLKEMASGFSGSKTLVLGAGPYMRKKGLLNKLIRFDAGAIAIQYLSFAKAGIPYMGVGRNLGYTEELYDSVRGFKNHYFLASGDDDLFVNEAGNKKNTSVVFNPDSITLSEPKTSFSKWWFQKRRHMTTGKHYKTGHKLLLGLYPLSLLIFYSLFAILMVIHNWWYIALSILAFRVLLQIIIFSRPLSIMGARDIIILTPIMELIMLLLNPLLMIKNKLNKPARWG